MPWSNCVGNCPVITWCWGGCREYAFSYVGDRNARFCNKEYTIAEALLFFRFKYRDRIAKWLYNRANGLEDDDESYYKEIAVSQA
jgi:sulfatase maturation enzyme AslB (radical SAM superfamily)